jgi:hypothetical protein
VPAAVALVVIAYPLISVLFERGAFDRPDTVATAWTLAVYGLGLPAFVLHKVLQPLFYAREDTSRPFRYAVWSMVVNAAVAVGLGPCIVPGLGFLAAAPGTTVAGWTMVWQLWRGARTLGDAGKVDDRLRRGCRGSARRRRRWGWCWARGLGARGAAALRRGGGTWHWRGSAGRGSWPISARPSRWGR